ncbi:MAG TPA: class I SAM-dependent methyltransferase [Thermoanaerobaculia bacterium]
MDQRYELFGAFAARYDLHTPPDHYQPDHEFVLDELRRFGPGARVLDLGCGTGAFLQRARDAGFDASGIDISREMVAVAEQRLGPGAVRVQRLQDVDEREAYDALVSLSLPFNYCSGVSEAREALAGFHRALRPGGLLVLQVIHAPNAPDRLIEEWEPGPGGEKDIQFLCRFTAQPGGEPALRAEYVYSCRSLNELLYEDHLLNVADVSLVAELLRETGFSAIRIYDNSQREPLSHSVAPFVLGFRPAVP